MKDFLLGLLDWIYKKKCYCCGSSKDCLKMCNRCYEELDFLPVGVNREFNGCKIYCAGVYSKNLQKIIRGIKYHKQRDLAYFIAKFMYQYWQRIGMDGDFEIIPVPIYSKRKKQRKYNHMELIAQEFSYLSCFEVNTALIKRIKDTKPQYKLKKTERMINLDKAFEVDKTKYNKDKKLLLIDDICTTGSTFEEMIREFNKSGINDIVCLAATTPFI